MCPGWGRPVGAGVLLPEPGWLLSRAGVNPLLSYLGLGGFVGRPQLLRCGASVSRPALESRLLASYGLVTLAVSLSLVIGGPLASRGCTGGQPEASILPEEAVRV